MHERGQVSGFGVIERMRDADEGDLTTVERLRGRAGSLRRQIREASELATPPEVRARSGVEEAASRAQRILAESRSSVGSRMRPRSGNAPG